MGPTRLQFTQAKAHLSGVFDEVVRIHTVRIVERQKFPPVVLLESDALADLLTNDVPFATRMARSGDEVVPIGLDECDVYARGEELPAAIEDLLGEVEDYVQEWEEQLQGAPNHADPGAAEGAALHADPDVVDHRRVSS